jgi:hypothetical protein
MARGRYVEGGLEAGLGRQFEIIEAALIAAGAAAPYY